MRRAVIAALLLLAGCGPGRVAPADSFGHGNASGAELALLDERLTQRTDIAEQHLVDRLERIERNQYLIMVRLGVKP